MFQRLRRKKVDWERLIREERELDIEPSLPPVVPNTPHAFWKTLWWSFSKTFHITRIVGRAMIVAKILGIVLAVIVAIVSIIFGFMQIPGPAANHPPPLPPHTLVMAGSKFLVDPHYTGLGTVLCSESEYEVKQLADKYIIICGQYGAHDFSYPRSKRFSYAIVE